jgi:hypothetical protein
VHFIRPRYRQALDIRGTASGARVAFLSGLGFRLCWFVVEYDSSPITERKSTERIASRMQAGFGMHSSGIPISPAAAHRARQAVHQRSPDQDNRSGRAKWLSIEAKPSQAKPSQASRTRALCHSEARHGGLQRAGQGQGSTPCKGRGIYICSGASVAGSC